MCFGPIAWNSLILHFRSALTLSTFKNMFKTHFFAFLLHRLTVSGVRAANIVRGPCSYSIAMLLRLINCRIILIVIIKHPNQKCATIHLPRSLFTRIRIVSHLVITSFPIQPRSLAKLQIYLRNSIWRCSEPCKLSAGLFIHTKSSQPGWLCCRPGLSWRLRHIYVYARSRVQTMLCFIHIRRNYFAFFNHF